MEKIGRGIMEGIERYKERKLREEREGIKIVDGLIFDNPKPFDQQIPAEPVQQEEQQIPPESVQNMGQHTQTFRKIKRKHPKSEETDGQKQAIIGVEKEPPFSQRYTRVTTYLENSLSDKVKELSREGRISSVTALVNAALKEFLNKYEIQ
jgi:hypothetical protein